MKKLLSLTLFLISVAVFSQPISLPITWDQGGVDYTTGSFGGNTAATAADPSNAANTVLKLNKPGGAQVWAGTTLGNPGVNNGGFPSPIPMTATDHIMTIRVRSTKPAGTQMMAKIENYTNGGIFVEKRVNTTVAAGNWENMVFDFSTGDQPINYSDIYGKISFFPDFLNGGDGTQDYYVDNVAMGLPPVISSFSPTSETSGNTVVITGSNFTGATAVSFGSSPAASFTVVNDNTINAVVGVGASGSITVTTPVSFESLAGFTFIPPATAPTITSFTPTSAASGATVTITGTNFTTATAVNFGGDAALSFVVINATTITAVVDLGNSGSVAVTNPDGVGTLAGFTYIPPAPTVASFTPTSSGQFATVTITGTNFIDISAVTFGGTAASSFVVVNTTTITAVVGAGASGSVAVTNPGGTGTLAGYTFKSPISLPITFGSASVDYTTTDFGNNVSILSIDPLNGANGVLRIEKPAGAQVWAGSTLGKDFAPKVNNGGLTAPIPFTASSKFITARVYSPKPIGTPIRCKVENAANGGISAEVDALTTVQNGWSTLTWNLTGVNLGNTYEKISFFMNFLGGGVTGEFFYLDDVDFYPAPTISSFTPTSATTGATVTISGTNFTGASAVSFGGVAATSFVVVNSTTITAVVGLGASGSVSVTRGGVGTLAGFTFNAAPTGATVTSFTPTSAGETGVVTITGTNFLTATAVSFGGTAAASFAIVDDNTITAVLGSGTSGAVAVTNPSGIGSLPGFSYIPKAAISLPITWDSPITVDYTTSDFGGPILTSSQDVDPLNPLNKVLKVIKGTGAQTWAGTTLGKSGVNNGGFFAPIPFTPSNRFMTARVYSTRPIGTIVMMKVEQGTAPPQNSETQAVTTVQNAWETLVFDFGTTTGGNPLNYSGVDYDKVSLFFNFGTPGTPSANTFYLDDVRFVPGPLISSFTPTSAATGATVTINGDNFTGATAVSFGGLAATSFTVVNDNQITAVVGAGFSGSVSVTTIGVGTLAGFDWIAPPGAPVISSFSPTSSYAGDVVSIFGSNFTSATLVRFGGTNAASYTIVNSSRIDAVVGPGTTGAVTVTNGFGTGSRPGFTFAKRPIALPVIWDDFATVQYNSGDFCTLVSALATDPLDASNTVMRLTKPAGGAGCAGTLLGNTAMVNPIPFALGNTTISVRFYTTQPVGFPVLFKLEGTAGPIEKLLLTTSVGWQILKFDYSASANLSDIYNKLIIFPGFNQVPGSAQVTYVDNIIFGEFPTNVWKGVTSSDFLKGSNWSLGFAPLDCSMDVQVNAGTPFPAILASGSYGAGNVNIATGASLTVNTGATYSICGNVTNGNITGNGVVVMNGTAAQAIAGNNTIDNITITKPAASGVVTINGTTRVKGVLTLSNANSSVVVGGLGKLILVSDASGTGSIGAIPAGASVTGNVTQQRYLIGTTGGWFFVGTPILGGDFSQWTDNIYMSAGTTLGGNQGVVPLGIQHSTIFKYDDAFHNVTPDTAQKRGWRVPVLGDLLSPGRGFRLWLKGHTPTRTLDNVGTVHQGPFSFPTLNRTEPAVCQPNVSPGTIACDESFRGWNFLANPYPSALNWDATGGAWTKDLTKMADAFYRWNSAGSGYGVYSGGSYVGAGPAPANPNLIPSGQGFFVKLSTSGVYTTSLSVNETAKVSGSGTFMRNAVSTSNILKIRLEKPSMNGPYSYMGEVRFDANASDGKDSQLDIPNLAGDQFYFSMPVASEQMILNTMGQLTGTKTVPLNTQLMGSSGTYQFVVSNLESFGVEYNIYVRDNFLGTIQNVSFNPVYSFEVDGDNLAMSNRFELVFSADGVTSTELAINGISISLYPNPATGKQIKLSVNGDVKGAGQVVITDLLGKVVLSSALELSNGQNDKMLGINLASGMYTVKVKTATKTVSQKLIVR